MNAEGVAYFHMPHHVTPSAFDGRDDVFCYHHRTPSGLKNRHKHLEYLTARARRGGLRTAESGSRADLRRLRKCISGRRKACRNEIFPQFFCHANDSVCFSQLFSVSCMPPWLAEIILFGQHFCGRHSCKNFA